jgi:hypothetical protein
MCETVSFIGIKPSLTIGVSALFDCVHITSGIIINDRNYIIWWKQAPGD